MHKSISGLKGEFFVGDICPPNPRLGPLLMPSAPKNPRKNHRCMSVSSVRMCNKAFAASFEFIVSTLLYSTRKGKVRGIFFWRWSTIILYQFHKSMQLLLSFLSYVYHGMHESLCNISRSCICVRVIVQSFVYTPVRKRVQSMNQADPPGRVCTKLPLMTLEQ